MDLASLRHRTFFSLAELNAAIAKLLQRLNPRPFQRLEGAAALPSRRSTGPRCGRSRFVVTRSSTESAAG